MFKFAVQNLLSRPLRTALAILGLLVAVAGMVGLFSIAGGINRLVTSTFELIPGMLVQQRGAPVPIFSVLPAAWGLEIESLPGVRAVNAEVLTRVNRIDQRPIVSPPRFLLGVDIENRLKLQHGVYDEHLLPGGRFLRPDDRGTRNCLISRQIAEQFGKQVGDVLQANGVDLTIVGIYHCGSLLLDVNILLDIDAVRELARIDRETVSCFYVEQDGSLPDAELARRIEAHFAGRDIRLQRSSGLEQFVAGLFSAGGVPDSADRTEAESPIEVRTQEGWSERFDDFTADLRLFLGIMTAVGMLIAAFSIVNTMLMSVTERMVEFGILRANGWTQRNVLTLITCESGWLGLVGGVCGAAAGWGVVQGVNAWQPDRLHLYAGPQLLAFSVLFSIVLGTLSGLYPAWRAATKPPMEAIRRI